MNPANADRCAVRQASDVLELRLKLVRGMKQELLAADPENAKAEYDQSHDYE